ncbi:DUF2218 domain-containing protein [Actinomycetaceae bacterium MB13-C1-2]|nr:DUF2218 domain-containing protein [Actinomycetaceae bacterium MB13-C1-2]
MVTHSTVKTDRPERYAKQLVSHLSRKCQSEEVEHGTRLRIAPPEGPVAYGTVLVVPGSEDGAGSLVLIAEGDSEEALERAKMVLGNHLVRFGEKDGLVVEWHDGPLGV